MIFYEDLIDQINAQLKNMDQEEQTALLIGFFRQDKKIVRQFIEYCSTESEIEPYPNKGWITIKKNLQKIIQQEIEEQLLKKKKQFIKDLEEFKIDCISSKYLEEADFEEKRHAYASGDIYFEDYIYKFLDEHVGFQTYIGFLKVTDKYYKELDYATASKAYLTLIEIYKFDTEVKKCFVDDDDFPDLDLEEISEVDIKKMNAKLNDCLLKLKSQC